MRRRPALFVCDFVGILKVVSLLAVFDCRNLALELGEVIGVGFLRVGLLAAGIKLGVDVGDVADHLIVGVTAAMSEDGDAVILKELVDGAAPVGKRQIFAHLDAQLGALEEDRDEAVQSVNLVGCEIVLRDDDVAFPDDAAAP